MSKIRTIFLILATLNLTSILVYYLAVISELKSSKTKDFLQKDSLKKEISVTISDSVFDRSGVFDILGAYPEFKMSTYSYLLPKYETTHLGLYNDDDYCERVDAYNLAKPDNMFKNKNFFTDFGKGTLPRVSAMGKVGTIYNKDIDIWMNSVKAKQAQFHLSHEITTFYTINNMHVYHRIGKNFLCATQMYNHIPGSGFLVRKTDVLEGVVQYTKKHENQPECYNKSTYFLPAHRLYKKEECEQFFKIIHSQDYKDSLKVEPIQYLIKIGVGAHKSQGVFLLDDSQTNKLNTDFDFGKKCGEVKGTLIAQKYITNPLLLDMNNKFDFRMYMLIASSNPLIVYYHDGYLRVSVNTFDKSSKDRATHLTNTYLADQVFDKLKQTNATVHGMNAQQLKDYHLWYLKDLQNYLLKAGKITDPKWLDNYLRPAFQKAFIHLTKMTSHHFLKNSNVFELHGLDFMLDSDLNLWFIEDNSNPLLIGVKPDLIATMLKDMFEVQYAYYRSRMKRILKVVHKLQNKLENQEEIDYEAFREEYQKASLNRLEPEYKISKKNTFVLVLDEGLPANKASFGHFPAKCFQTI